MLSEKDRKFIELLKEARRYMDAECEECEEISPCSPLRCWGYRLKECIDEGLAKAEALEQSDMIETLF